MRRSLGYVVRFPGPVLLALACLLAGSGLSLLGPLLVRLVIDDGISRRDGHRLAVLAGAFLAVEAVRTAVEVSQTYVLRRLSLRLSGALRRDVFHHLQGVSLSWFDATPAGRIVDRVTGDAAALGDALSGGTVGLLRDLLTLVGVTIVALHLDLRFGAITLGSALLVGIPALLIRRSAQKRSVLALDAVSRANSVLEENISGRSVIALFGIESDRGERFDRENGTLLQVSLSSLRMRVFFDAGASVVSALALTLIIGLGGMEVSSGRITAGLLVAFVQYGTSLLGAVRGTAEKAVAVLSGMAAGERIFETLDLPSAAVLRVEPEASKAAERGIVLTTVRFGYRPDVEILRGVSATIAPGMQVALVGRTGAGKTTLARLIGRLYDPGSGTIRWNGRDLRDISPAEFRRRLCYLPQDVSIFRDTVLENVRLGDERLDREAVVEACKAVSAHAFIQRLPRGYDTELGRGVEDLSRGERQLLAFARVLLRKPEVLILDEPTAGIDPRTEALVLEAVRRLLAGRTSIVIAHRFSTIQSADRILVMDGGEILQAGTPEELMAQSGQYRRIAECQSIREFQKRSADHGK